MSKKKEEEGKEKKKKKMWIRVTVFTAVCMFLLFVFPVGLYWKTSAEEK